METDCQNTMLSYWFLLPRRRGTKTKIKKAKRPSSRLKTMVAAMEEIDVAVAVVVVRWLIKVDPSYYLPCTKKKKHRAHRLQTNRHHLMVTTTTTTTMVNM